MTETPPDKVLKIFDASGNFIGVFIPAEQWEKISGAAPPNAPDEHSHDLAGFNELMESWTFSYPYDPSVICPVCGNASTDWREDADMPFILSSANMGGLLVFRCNKCDATIRHKYYKNKVVKEHSE